MEQLRKVVAAGCLTYVLYGLISWFQLGVFLPPLPVKPFLFLGFVIFGLVNAIQAGVRVLDISFYLWLIFISVINQSFLELLLSTPQLMSFQGSIEVVFQLMAVILFVTFNVLVILSLRKTNKNFMLYFILLITLIILVFTLPNYVNLKVSTILMGTIYFITNRFTDLNKNLSVERSVIIFTGVSLVEAVEMIALFQ